MKPQQTQHKAQKQMINFLCVIVSLSLIIACKKTTPTPPVEKTPVVAPAQTPELTGPEIPGLPQDIMKKLLNKCTYIDYIFHNYTFSISQNEDTDIDRNINFIDINKPLGRLVSGCKPMARKFFHIKGNIEYDVDVYLSDKCSYYVFVDKKNKPIYANIMTETGKEFYASIIKQATGALQNK
jgi:hypothetical protein